jgi:hypothetical protein
MTAKYEVIGSQTLTSSAASVTFSSIPGGYKDLVLSVEYKSDAGATNIRPIFNSDSGSNYSYVLMSGDGNSTVSGSGTVAYVRSYQNCSATSTEAHTLTYQIQDYSATDKHKTTLIRGNSVGSYSGTEAFANRWASTAAITSITCNNPFTNFAIGSTFRLLGVN